MRLLIRILPAATISSLIPVTWSSAKETSLVSFLHSNNGPRHLWAGRPHELPLRVHHESRYARQSGKTQGGDNGSTRRYPPPASLPPRRSNRWPRPCTDNE